MSEEIEKHEILFIAYIRDGWYIVDANNELLQGPYQDHEEAEAAIKTRAWRVAQGWAV